MGAQSGDMNEFIDILCPGYREGKNLNNPYIGIVKYVETVFAKYLNK